MHRKHSNFFATFLYTFLMTPGGFELEAPLVHMSIQGISMARGARGLLRITDCSAVLEARRVDGSRPVCDGLGHTSDGIV